MPLTIGCTAVPAPGSAAGKDPAVEFAELEQTFGLDPKVAQYLLSMGLATLYDFSHLLTNASEVGPLVIAKVEGLDKGPLQTARLRQAWEAVKKGGEADDMDAILPKHDLDARSDFMWKRHRLLPSHG